jgi:glutamate formiminotransferase/glutamate formiminotransferase/formiminotetrahydrofolate cyclodeaminase
MCVMNVSEGRRRAAINAIAAAAGASLLDVHTDAHHHRSVLTLAGPDVEAAARAMATMAVSLVDLRTHHGMHPRLGAVDVAPFVPLAETTPGDACAAQRRFAGWMSEAFDVPCFLYGSGRSLPDVRRRAFRTLWPGTGPVLPHPSAGATCVGARPVLVAYNLWLRAGAAFETARTAAAAVRGPAVRALAFEAGGRVQVSMNLVDPLSVGPAHAYDAVARHAEVDGAQLVGLIPAAVLTAVPRHRWPDLDLDPSRTIEARLEAAGL